MPQPDKNANTRITFISMLFLNKKKTKTKKPAEFCPWVMWMGWMGWEIRPNPSLTKFIWTQGQEFLTDRLDFNPAVEDNKGLGLV